jgi:opacity protein-like surface antigen
MKRNFIAALSCLMVISISTLAYGAEGPYVSLNIGPAFAYDMDISEPSLNSIPATLDFDLDTGLTLSTSIGYDANFFRYELELLYQKNDLDTYNINSPDGSATGALNGDITSLALMFNGYFDIRSFSNVVPYLTAGVGFANVEMSSISLNVPGETVNAIGDDDNVFAYQVGIGVAYNVNETVTADLKYRYFATADPNFSTATAEFSSHNIHVGLRFAF